MLTFDKIRELERNERDSKKLQRLPDDIIEQLKDYLYRKEKIKEKTAADILELENVKNTIRRFFELRENKIMNAAIDTARTGMPPENMTREEENVFYNIVAILKDHREKFFEELQKEPKKDIKEEKEIKKNNNEKRFVYVVKKTLPTFVGPDLKIYELKENDIIEIGAFPKPLNDLLIKEGIIEKKEM
ncbi:MAG: hypothetical protein QXD48_02375 [Candidatus Aenigmatarchaeota archaeon]